MKELSAIRSFSQIFKLNKNGANRWMTLLVLRLVKELRASHRKSLFPPLRFLAIERCQLLRQHFLQSTEFMKS